MFVHVIIVNHVPKTNPRYSRCRAVNDTVASGVWEQANRCAGIQPLLLPTPTCTWPGISTALSLPTPVHLGGISLKGEPEELCRAQTVAGLVMHPRAQVTCRNFVIALRIFIIKNARTEKRPAMREVFLSWITITEEIWNACHMKCSYCCPCSLVHACRRL